MQEYKKCVKGGAGVARLCRRTCHDQEVKKRDSRALGISRSHLCADERELQSFFCLCDCGRPNNWSDSGMTPSSSAPLPALDPHTCNTHSAVTTNTPASPGTDLLTVPDNVNYLLKSINCTAKEGIVILYNDNILTKLFSDAFDCQGSVGITGQGLNNNLEDVFQSIDPDWPEILNNKDQHEPRQSDLRNEVQADSSICDEGYTGETSAGIRRKSVSFADDVIVYLYDQDDPTGEPQSSSSFISDISFDDNALEWDDDFLVLEENRGPLSRPGPHRSHCAPPNWTVNRPKHVALPQSVLFLTHISDSDLEL